MAYQPKVYKESGGNALVVASGGTATIAGTMDITGAWKIAGVTVTASAAALNTAGGSVVDLDCGSDAVAGTIDIFPATTIRGKLRLSCVDNAADHTVTLTNASHSQASTYSIPDSGVAASRVVVTTGVNSLLVNCNSSNRSMSLSGNVSAAGAVTLGGAFITGGAVTFSGADTIQFTTAGANTYVLPATGGTLALATGAETGTTASSFTVDSDSANAKIALNTNSATGNFTASIVPANLTADRTVTIQDATDTVVGRATTDILTNKTLTAAVLNGASTAAAANNFSLHTGSGAFTTPTGQFTHYGNVANNGNLTWTWSSSGAWNMSGSSGTFQTPSGATAINGEVTVATGKNVTLTNGYVACSGSTSGSIKIAPTATGTNETSIVNQGGGSAKVITLPAATASLATIGLSEALDLKTLTNAGAITQTGATTITSGTTGIVIPDANTAGLAIHAASGKGYINIKAVDNTGDTALTINNELQGQATTLTIPDVGTPAGQFVCTNAAQTCVIATGAADRTITLAGNINIAGNLTTTVGAVALAANAAGSSVTLPQTGTVATLAGTEALTNKSIDGDDNTITDLAATAPKIAVTAGVAGAPVPGIPISIHATMAAAGSATYTVPVGKTLRVLDVRGMKTVGAGAPGDTVTVLNGGNAITDAISVNLGDILVFQAASYDDAYTDVAGAGTLVVTTAGAATCQCRVVITGVWV